MKTSEQIGELAAALAKAQAEMRNPTKNKSNPAFKGAKYADLAAIVDAIRTPLSSHGLAYVQMPATTDKHELGITTRLMHASGQWIEETYFVPVSKNDAQGFGSAMTYARRYSLAAVCGVSADDDDDGNAASSGAPPKPEPVKLAPQAIADLKASLDEAQNVDDLKARTKTALAAAQADADAFKEIRTYAIGLAEVFKQAA